jgi:hypothetical protein
LLYLFDVHSYRRNTKRSLPYRTCCFIQRRTARNVPVRKHYTAGYYDYKGNKNREAGFGITVFEGEPCRSPTAEAAGLNMRLPRCARNDIFAKYELATACGLAMTFLPNEF